MRRWRARRPWLLLLGSVLLAGFAGDDLAREAVSRGNAHYAAGEYQAAAAAYALAAAQLPDRPEISFDQGAASAGSFDYDAAMHYFDAALASDDQRFLARCRYNMGVVSYRQALDAMQSFQDARGFAVAAIRHLRASLALQPDQADTRFNLELGYRLLAAIDAQMVQAQRHAETRDQKTSDNQGQPFQEQPETKSDQQENKDVRAQPEPDAKGQRSASMPGDGARAQSMRQMPDPGAQPELTAALAEQKLELLRDRAKAAQAARREAQRMRTITAREAKFW